MITDRELDAQLAGAAGVRDADLPALPEEFLGHLQADDVLGYLMGETDREPASVLAARQLVADAREARTAPRRRPRRKLLVRAGVAVVAIAAAWTTAVAVTPANRPGTPDGPTATQTGGIELVAAAQVTFPLTLEPAPAGLTPTYSMVGGVGYHADLPLVFTADYFSGGPDRILINVFADDPRDAPDSGWSFDEAPNGSATVAGTAAEVRRGNGFVGLLWERPDGRWVRILGEGAYGELAALASVAESLVDRPQPLDLQFGLAPVGWSVTGFEESRSIDLTRDGDPRQLLRLSVYPPGGDASLDDLLGGPDLAGPVTPVTIQGREGRLALVDGYENPDFWRAAGQFPDGARFLLLAPPVLTEEQVLQIAEQVTYTR